MGICDESIRGVRIVLNERIILQGKFVEDAITDALRNNYNVKIMNTLD